jgi:hypothetical protein
MTDIFISYRRDEQKECARIAEKLQALQFNVWFDAHLASGESFTKEIEAAVKRAKVVLVLWSPSAVSSRWVRNEADMGRERNVLVAVQIKPCDMPIEFRDIHFDPLHDPNFADDDPQWLKVLDRIGKLTDRPGLSIYSESVGRAGRSLLRWAEQFPRDVLASHARTMAREFTEKAQAAPKRSGVAAPLIGLVALLAGGAAGYFASTLAPLSSQAALVPTANGLAGEVVGVWNEVGLGDCGSNALTISLNADGLVAAVGDASEVQPIAGVDDGWLVTQSGVRYRRNGANLVSRLGPEASDAEYTPCA